MGSLNRYQKIIERVFFKGYGDGDEEVAFTREDLVEASRHLGVRLPKNLGDIIYSFRYRSALPESVIRAAPEGKDWIIRPAGPAKYRFVATALSRITPNEMLAETKLPDATPGVIEMYALTDEQALLARLRYNRLIDVFTGLTCYSLQNHLRTTAPGLGQVETDELYVGIDKRGAHYVLPVQAKGGTDVLSVVQVEQDVAVCRSKFEALVCRPMAAQFMRDELIALFEFEAAGDEISLVAEKHYRLVPQDQVTEADLRAYLSRPLDA